ncbi:FAD/NAD-linked reductase [Lactarius indigo]|nr:FAD/NAD-linked reductase [Lactarius indigo]
MPSPYSSSTRVYYRSEEHHHCNKSEVAPFFGSATKIDEQQIISSTDALLLQKVREEGYDWQQDHWTGDGERIDEEISKQFQKSTTKQSLKFKSSTKVLSAEKMDGKVVVTAEGAKDGKQDSLEADVILVAVGCQPYVQGPGVENYIGDVISGPIPAHKAEEGGITAVEYYIHSGHGHVNYGTIPSVVYTHSEIAWVKETEQGLKTDCWSTSQVKFLVEMETDRDRILDAHIIGPNAGEMITEGALALECDASAESIASTTNAHPTLSEAFREAALQVSSGSAIHF